MASDLQRPTGGTREQFVAFARTRDTALRDELVEANLGLARLLARRFQNRGEPYDDLFQVASIALVKSLDRFDPERGVEFSTFATRTIVGELKRHFRDKGWSVRAPRRLQELYLELGHAIETLSHELGRSPTVPELAEITGASEEAVIEALEAGQGYRSASIDAPDGSSEDADEPMSARLGEIDRNFAGIDDRALLAQLLATLGPREQLILQLRFFDGLTQTEIAQRLEISQMHVSRLLAASLSRLRSSFASEG